MLSAQTTTIPEGVTKGASVEGITEYQLKNGLRVLLFPDPSKPTITVNITYLVGSRHEGYGETGMAHLLEHLVFKGTPNHPNIPQELTEHGARPNGTTWYDRTNYFETFNATEENLRWALDLEADRMINSFIAKEDLDSEMTVVRNEFESGENSPSRVLLERVLSTAYLWHNYGQSTIGARSDLENVPIERLKAFYKKYYQPDNAVLLVAGKIDEVKTLELVDEYFSSIPRPERQLYPTYTKEPAQDGERFVTLRRTGDVQVVSCAYHTPPGAHPHYAPVSVTTQLLTSEPSGRLYKALVETKKASYQWGFAPALKEGGFLYLNADVRKENSLDEARDVMLETLDNLSTNPPTPEEVARAKARILKNLDLAFNNSERVGTRMSEYIAQGDWRLFFLYRDAVEAVTVEDVVNVANIYFKPSNRTVGLFYPTIDPELAEIPDAPDVAELVKDYKGRADIATGEAFDPSPGNIAKRTQESQMKGGLELALLAKKTRGKVVVANMTFRYGTAESLKEKGMLPSLTASMLDKGTSQMNRQEIQDKLDALNARVSFSGRLSAISQRLETERDNLLEVVELVEEMLKNPTFDKQEFSKLIEEQLSFREESLY
ncbi:MAG: insulinase family protein [Bacteroidota bacterium]